MKLLNTKLMTMLTILIIFSCYSCHGPYDKYFSDGGVYIGYIDMGRDTDKELAELISQARASSDKLKRFVEKGVPKLYKAYVIVTIYESPEIFEKAYISVFKWDGEIIRGAIENKLNIVTKVQTGNVISINQKDIMDWSIVYPNGRIEGDYINKHYAEDRWKIEE